MGNSTSTPAASSHLYLLPPELIDQALTYITIPDFISFRNTCKRYSKHLYSGLNYPRREEQLTWLLDLPSHPDIERIVVRSLKFTKISHQILLTKSCQLNYHKLLSTIISPKLNLDNALLASVKSCHGATLRILLNNGGNANLSDDISRSLLEHAVRSQLLAPVQILLEHAANVNVHDDRHATPLRTAASLGLEKVVQLLLDFGATIDAVDPDGYSALTWGVLYGREAVVRTLIDMGGNKNITARDGRSLGDIGREYGHENMVSRLELE